VEGEYTTSLNTEERCREFVLDFIRNRGLIKSEDNLILSEKVFVVNAVLKWCYKSAHQKKMTTPLWNKYKRALAQYIAGVVDIKWTENNFEIIEVIKKDDEPRRRSSRRRKK
jgi:hypothetical protein|tara:strand:- start:3672 stop:4007 length:336 start_codon:yes stop_codon:yes gene_type:complete